MYAKIIRVKCSHSSKPLHGCEIFRKDARLLGTYNVSNAPTITFPILLPTFLLIEDIINLQIVNLFI